MEDAHFFTVNQVLATFKVDPNQGLDEKQIEQARAQHGSNKMEPPERTI
jgi:hypothetical protein